MLRLEVRKALAADPSLAAEVADLLKAGPVIAGMGSQVISGSHIGGGAIQIGNAHDVDIRRG
ncbi:hypothetical protein [Acrocarpospora sp. B8E8]|uniref:hypothetical protein n=1 Tax=Acrocarpospora sp. B8E8 TaxID=3153572 RepID=UPI00325C7799